MPNAPSYLDKCSDYDYVFVIFFSHCIPTCYLPVVQHSSPPLPSYHLSFKLPCLSAVTTVNSGSTCSSPGGACTSCSCPSPAFFVTVLLALLPAPVFSAATSVPYPFS